MTRPGAPPPALAPGRPRGWRPVALIRAARSWLIRPQRRRLTADDHQRQEPPHREGAEGTEGRGLDDRAVVAVQRDLHAADADAGAVAELHLGELGVPPDPPDLDDRVGQRVRGLLVRALDEEHRAAGHRRAQADGAAVLDVVEIEDWHAAIKTLGKQLDIPVYRAPQGTSVPDIARQGLEAAKRQTRDVVILDTAGRLSVDEELMQEIAAVDAAVKPIETLLVVDAMTGQEAVSVAQAFVDAVPVTGLVLTKIDGDARGGAALSISAVTGLPSARLRPTTRLPTGCDRSSS